MTLPKRVSRKASSSASSLSTSSSPERFINIVNTFLAIGYKCLGDVSSYLNPFKYTI